MNKFTNAELLEVLPTGIVETKELTTKQKIVLAQLVIYNGLEQTKANGFFYRSNKDLCDDCDIQEKTIITAVNKLESMGFIERKKGQRGVGASEYKINMNTVNDYCKMKNENYSINYSKQIEEMSLKINSLENTVKSLEDKITVLITVIEGKNYSTDTDIESDTDIEKDINNNIYIEENILKNKIEEKGTFTNDNCNNGIHQGSENESTSYQLLGISQTAISLTDIPNVSQCSETQTNNGIIKLESNSFIPTVGDMDSSNDFSFDTVALASTAVEDVVNQISTETTSVMHSNERDGEIVQAHSEMLSNATKTAQNDINTDNDEKLQYQIGILLERLKGTVDDREYMVKLGKFRNWLMERGMSSEQFKNDVMPQVNKMRQDFKEGKKTESAQTSTVEENVNVANTTNDSFTEDEFNGWIETLRNVETDLVFKAKLNLFKLQYLKYGYDSTVFEKEFVPFIRAERRKRWCEKHKEQSLQEYLAMAQ